MPHFFIILFKINLVLLLFAAVYYLVLRRLTFYVINRVFLVFGILFSTAYPLINLTAFFSRHQAVPEFVPQFNQNVSQLAQQESVYWSLLSILFYAGVILMAIRLIIQFVSLYRVHKNSDPGWFGDYKIRVLKEEVSPFSFWKTIYVNPLLHRNHDLNSILEHERVHVEEWHTIDIILAEICVVFYWFNPGVWLMKKAVKENIEFITDAKILKKGINKKSYQYSLLHVGNLQPCTTIVNNFNISDLKMRIKMMNARRSSPLNLSRYLFFLPALLLVTLAFTIKKREIQKDFSPSNEAVTPHSDRMDVLTIQKVALKSAKRKIAEKEQLTKAVLTVHDAGNIITSAIQSIHKPDSVAVSLKAIQDDYKMVKSGEFISLSGKNSNGKITKIRISYADTAVYKFALTKRVNTSLDGKEDDQRTEKDKKVTMVLTSRYVQSADSAVKKGSIFLNGQKISENQLKNKIDPNKIGSIDIMNGKPGNGGLEKGIYIYTKD